MIRYATYYGLRLMSIEIHEETMTSGDQEKDIQKANRLFKKGKLRKALEILEKVVNENPQSVNGFVALGVHHNFIYNFKEPERNYRLAESLSPKDPNLKWQIGQFLVGLNRPIDALPYLEFSIQEWPSNSQAHALIGKAFLQLKRYEEAEAALNKALVFDNFNPDAWDLTVDLYLETERDHLIEGFLQEYLAKAPKLASSHIFMAEYLMILEGDSLGSLSFFETGFRLAGNRKHAPLFRRYFSTAGYPQSIAYDYSNALMDCGYQDLAKDVVRENLVGTYALAWKANVSRSNKNLDTAIQLMEEAIAKEPYNRDWKHSLGWTYILAGKPHLAEMQYREGLQMYGAAFSEVRDLAAMYIILTEQSNTHDAERYKKEALAKDSENFWLSVAALYTEMENWEKTLEACQLGTGRHILS
jgi:tetratricopeptide (TPR) repeat protein